MLVLSIGVGIKELHMDQIKHKCVDNRSSARCLRIDHLKMSRVACDMLKRPLEDPKLDHHSDSRSPTRMKVNKELITDRFMTYKPGQPYYNTPWISLYNLEQNQHRSPPISTR